MKWSNALRFDPTGEGRCLHFTASTKGTVFVIFSAIPKDKDTWYYVQISPYGVGMFKVILAWISFFAVSLSLSLPSFLLSLLSSIRTSFFHSLLRSFLPSFPPSFYPYFLLSLPPLVIPYFFPSFLSSLHPSVHLSIRPSVRPSVRRSIHPCSFICLKNFFLMA